MREILFRGKRTVNGEWVEGWYEPPVTGRNPDGSEVSFSECITFVREEDGFLDDANIIHDTIGQYTGLTDKNGKKIFEGDIIQIPDDYEHFGHAAGEIYEVYFAYGGFRLRPKYCNTRGYWLEDDKTVEIIGNIHDNPELLGGADNA